MFTNIIVYCLQIFPLKENGHKLSAYKHRRGGKLFPCGFKTSLIVHVSFTCKTVLCFFFPSLFFELIYSFSTVARRFYCCKNFMMGDVFLYHFYLWKQSQFMYNTNRRIRYLYDMGCNQHFHF